ncbi:MAG: multicomponent Na+:H+ antiporter subunit F [Cellvibrionaceae bacterium]|jgi:multicomponent Na+:H+ antiporter subunit F
MIFTVLVIAILVSLLLVVVRALLGPTIYDRVLAVNSAGTKIVMLIAAYGFLTERPDFIDISLLYALINYMGTIAVLKFFDDRQRPFTTYQEDDL